MKNILDGLMPQPRSVVNTLLSNAATKPLDNLPVGLEHIKFIPDKDEDYEME